MHGHTMFVRTSVRSAEAYRGSENLGILQPPRSVLRPYIGLGGLCWHNFGNNRYQKALSIMQE